MLILVYAVEVDGNWGEWIYIGSCSDGRLKRTRKCDNPEPSTFGKLCKFLIGKATGSLETGEIYCGKSYL